MPTYTDTDALAAYNEDSGIALPTGDALTRLIERAERDIDRALGAVVREVTDVDSLLLVPADLTTAESSALTRATNAQAQYRAMMGEEFFVRAQFDSVNGPDFATQGKMPVIGPKAWDELSRSGLLRLTTTWHGRGDSPPWHSFTHNTD